VIRRQFGDAQERKAGRLDGSFHLRRAHSQFRLGTARRAEHRRFLARPRMPVDDGKESARHENLRNRSGEARPLGNAVEHIRQENEINRLGDNFGEIVGVGGYELAIYKAGLRQTATRQHQKPGVDVDRHDMAGEPRHRQREPSVARA
jgi:hypothetical protein